MQAREGLLNPPGFLPYPCEVPAFRLLDQVAYCGSAEDKKLLSVEPSALMAEGSKGQPSWLLVEGRCLVWALKDTDYRGLGATEEWPRKAWLEPRCGNAQRSGVAFPTLRIRLIPLM